MAKVIFSGHFEWGSLECSFCGKKYSPLPKLLNSRLRGGYYDKTNWDRIGTAAPEVKEFIEEHKKCPDPKVTKLSNDVTCIDKRIRKDQSI